MEAGAVIGEEAAVTHLAGVEGRAALAVVWNRLVSSLRPDGPHSGLAFCPDPSRSLSGLV